MSLFSSEINVIVNRSYTLEKTHFNVLLILLMFALCCLFCTYFLVNNYQIIILYLTIKLMYLQILTEIIIIYKILFFSLICMFCL